MQHQKTTLVVMSAAVVMIISIAGDRHTPQSHQIGQAVGQLYSVRLMKLPAIARAISNQGNGSANAAA